MKSNEVPKRILSFILMLAAYIMSAICAFTNFSFHNSVVVAVEILMGFLYLLGAALLAFLPYFADFYYNHILGLFFHNHKDIKPRAWFTRNKILAPTVIMLLTLITLNMIFTFM